MSSFLNDIKYALRQLRKQPGFTLVIMLTLAIGIGATTAIFSIVDTLILRPLPQENPDQLVCFRAIDKQRVYTSLRLFSPTIEQIAQHDNLFSELCTFSAGYIMAWENNGFYEDVHGARVSTNFFRFWNTAPLLGRDFLTHEDRPDRQWVIVLSHRFWQTQCGGRHDIVGDVIRFSNGIYTVVGIMPQHFRLPDEDCDFWIPHSEFHLSLDCARTAGADAG